MHIELQGDPGETIYKASAQAVRIAGILSMTVHFKFNDVTVIAKQHADPKMLERLYMQEVSSDRVYKVICHQPGEYVPELNTSKGEG